MLKPTNRPAVFPDDFEKKPHMISEWPEAGQNWQWLLCDAHGSQLVSVVGGDFHGLWGDGIETFEMWDFSEEDPRPHLTAEDINNHLRSKPVLIED